MSAIPLLSSVLFIDQSSLGLAPIGYYSALVFGPMKVGSKLTNTRQLCEWVKIQIKAVIFVQLCPSQLFLMNSPTTDGSFNSISILIYLKGLREKHFTLKLYRFNRILGVYNTVY